MEKEIKRFLIKFSIVVGFVAISIIATLCICAYYNYHKTKEMMINEAMQSIESIRVASKIYYAEYQKWPHETTQLKYLSISYDTKKRWVFAIYTNAVGIKKITATSTQEMPLGVGKSIEYYPESGEWIGLGLTVPKFNLVVQH